MPNSIPQEKPFDFSNIEYPKVDRVIALIPAMIVIALIIGIIIGITLVKRS